MGAHTERLPPFPWKYTINARGDGCASDQPRRLTPSAVASDVFSYATPKSLRRDRLANGRKERQSRFERAHGGRQDSDDDEYRKEDLDQAELLGN